MTTSPEKSSAIVLLGGTSEQKKSFLSFLTAICTGVTASQPLISGFKPPSPLNSSSGSSLYRIQRLNGVHLSVLDTPELSASNHQVQIARIQKAIEELVPTLNAIVVLGDANVDSLGLESVTPILDLIRPIFPRSISNNVYFLFMDNTGDLKVRREKLPDWLHHATCDTLEDMLSLLSNVNKRIEDNQDKEALHAKFSAIYDGAAKRIEYLLTRVEQYSVQSLDMRVLYRRAIEIESEVFEALADETNDLGVICAKDEKDIPKVDKLVDEYRLLSTSPDFLIHLDYFLPLLSHLGEASTLLEPTISKLEDTRNRLQILHGDTGLKYPKGYMID